MSSRKGIFGFILAIIGLWPVIFVAVFLLLLIFAGDSSAEFSLETKNVALNQTLMLVALGITFVLQIVALVLSVFARKSSAKGGKGRGLALWGIILSAFGILFFVLVVTAVVIVSQFLIPKAPTSGEEGEAEIKDKCISNRENIEVAIGPDMWGFDHPDDTAEDIVNLDLSPHGDLIDNDTGIQYINPGSLDCPADDDPEDTDYELYIDDEGDVRARCIDPAGMEQGHNDK